MEIKRTTQSSNIPFETETTEALQQPTISRGVAEASDSFVNAAQRDSLSIVDTTLQQMPTEQSATTQLVSDDSLQKQLEMSLIKANVFQIQRKPKLDFGDTPIEIIRLSSVTGKSVEQLQALFNKYGLDPSNLPKPPNSQVAALFNDPALDSQLDNLKDNVTYAYESLEYHINSAKSEANSINSSNLASDTSVYDNLDTTPFRFLNDAYKHKDPYSKALGQARNQLGERTAGLLSAMYPGEEIKLLDSTGQGQAGLHEGTIMFGNTFFNPCPNSTTGQTEFSKSYGVDWPTVQRIPWYYDQEGDAAVPRPPWMFAEDYPTIMYDHD